VAQLEKRTDFLQSTLRDYVKALGGELDLVVRFKGHAPVVFAGLSDESASMHAPARARKIARSRKSVAA
jgi:hypothetical protein